MAASPSPRRPDTVNRPRRRLFVGLVVVVATVAAALVGSGVLRLDRGPAPSDDMARIAIVSSVGGLSTIGADGTDRRTYPMPGVVFQFPAWSPDGSQVAAIGHDATEGGVFVVSDQPTQRRAAAPIVAYRSPGRALIYLYWSPDGRRIAFLESEPDELSLQIVVADGTGSAAVVRRGQPLYWDWIDASHLFVHSGGDALDAFLGEIDIEADDASPIVASVGPFQAPGISAGGRYRAFVVGGDEQSASIVVEARDGSVRHHADVLGPSALGWSPAGDQLAYIAPAEAIGLPVGSLRLIEADTGTTRPLLDGLVVAYFWAPDARTIAVLRVAVPDEDSVAAIPAIAPTEGRPTAEGDGLSLGLVFVDVATGSTRSKRLVRVSDLFVGQFLPFFDQYALSHRVWSPASEAIVLPLVDDRGAVHITTLPSDGSESRAIVDGVAAFWSP